MDQSPDDSWEQVETFPCDQLCQSDGKWIHHNRKALRCSLPGFSLHDWDSGEPRTRSHMGRLPILSPTSEDLDREPNLRTPLESHHEGCPGGWYRSGFAMSVRRYERMLTEGGFSGNVMLDKTDDPLIMEAIQYIEHESIKVRSQDNNKRYTR